MSWKVEATPEPRDLDPAFGAVLGGVAATSARNVWAVGSYYTSRTPHFACKALIEHWNGRAWALRASPSPVGSRYTHLSAVASSSSADAWAVGDRESGRGQWTLIEHWNGNAWTLQRTPNLVGALSGVSTTSSTNAWAVGYDLGGTGMRTLIERWNGKTWKVQASSNPRGVRRARLLGVAATSSTNAWAVGTYDDGTGPRPLIERWNGKAWTVQSSPNLHGSLRGVDATSSTDAWAVGYRVGRGGAKPLIEHWNGTSWTFQPVPSPRGSLFGVAAASAVYAWAVGSNRRYRLALHAHA
jgi:hypothetical protein